MKNKQQELEALILHFFISKVNKVNSDYSLVQIEDYKNYFGIDHKRYGKIETYEE
tara:strand:- start:10133 stop:10297 length:165 start_codon:yes stop_codon:yes gene_type:complete